MPLIVPDDLAARTAAGETVLFVGAGMSKPWLPGWSELLERMLEWACRQQTWSLTYRCRSLSQVIRV